jgi:hypothetical protein
VLRRYLAKWIHAVVKQLPVVRGDAAQELVARVAPENTQFFLDVLAKIDIGPAATHVLQECSDSKDDERYFTPAQKRRITARQQLRLEAEEKEQQRSEEESDDSNEKQRAANAKVEGPPSSRRPRSKRLRVVNWLRANFGTVALPIASRGQEPQKV